MILTQDRGLERQPAELSADFQRGARRKSQPAQPLRFDPKPMDVAVVTQRLNGNEIHPRLLESEA
jgi:hypothetical protein